MQLQATILTLLSERCPHAVAFVYFRYYLRIFDAAKKLVKSSLEAHLISINVVTDLPFQYNILSNAGRIDEVESKRFLRKITRKVVSAVRLMVGSEEYSIETPGSHPNLDVQPAIFTESTKKPFPDNGQFMAEDARFLEDFWTQDAEILSNDLNAIESGESKEDIKSILSRIFHKQWFINEKLSKDLVDYFCDEILTRPAPYNNLCSTISFGKPYKEVAGSLSVDEYWVKEHALKSAWVVYYNIPVEHWPLFLIFIRMWTTLRNTDVFAGEF